MNCTVNTSDGVRLTTRSRRRYVVFAISDGKAEIIGRSDDPSTAGRTHAKAKRSRQRVATVDTLNARITHDT